MNEIDMEKEVRCPGTCTYELSENGQLIICRACKRIKAMLKGPDSRYELLY
jgi:hypothetical protein